MEYVPLSTKTIQAGKQHLLPTTVGATNGNRSCCLRWHVARLPLPVRVLVREFYKEVSAVDVTALLVLPSEEVESMVFNLMILPKRQ